MATVGGVDDAAWDGEEPGFELPPAPIPSHERTWRHPSELGRSQYALTETRAIPRTVLAVAGLTGLALAVVLGRVLIPRDHDAPVNAGEPPSTVSPGSVVPNASRLSSTPAPQPSSPGYVVRIASTDALGVMWGDHRHIVTTAEIGDPGTMTQVSLPAGPVVDAVVVAVKDGLTIVELDQSVVVDDEAASVASTPPVPGPVVITGTDGAVIAASIADDSSLTLDGIAAASVGEGAPVMDGDGALVGLCGCVGDRPVLVPLAPVEPTIEHATLLGAWLGVHSGIDGQATVDQVADGSPAAVSGIEVGDTVVAIDGKPVSSVREVKARLRVVEPGATVRVTVRRGSERVVIEVETTSPPKTTPTTSVPTRSTVASTTVPGRSTTSTTLAPGTTAGTPSTTRPATTAVTVPDTGPATTALRNSSTSKPPGTTDAAPVTESAVAPDLKE